jgi:hypothetical protein
MQATINGFLAANWRIFPNYSLNNASDLAWVSHQV